MKLDLRKTRAATVVNEFDEDNIFLDDSKKDSIFSNLDISLGDIIHLLVRLALCAVGVIVLMYFERQNLDKLNGQKLVAQEEFNTLNGKKSKIEEEIKGLEYISEKSKEFSRKLAIMQSIVDNRLLAVKGLDFIQSVIPEEVWLREVRLNNKKFTIQGVSTTNKQIQNFIEELEKTDLFSSVSLAKAEEEETILSIVEEDLL